MTEDEMVGWYHRLKGHEFEQASGDGAEQGILVCCSPWGHKELEMTERLNKTEGFTSPIILLLWSFCPWCKKFYRMVFWTSLLGI